MLNVKLSIFFACFAVAVCIPYQRRRRQLDFTANSDAEGLAIGHNLVRQNFGDLAIVPIPLVHHTQETVGRLPSFAELIQEIAGKHPDLPVSADGLIPRETPGNSDLNALSQIVRG